MIVMRRQSSSAGLSAACLLMLLAGTTVAAQPSSSSSSGRSAANGSHPSSTTHTRSGPAGAAATAGQPTGTSPANTVTVETSPPPASGGASSPAGTAPMPTAPSTSQDEANGLNPEDVDPYPDDPASHGQGPAEGVAEASADAQGQPANGVKVSEYMTVDIFVQDEDLANVLQMLSLQSRRNIVASKDVNARVTANLYGVTFFEALDSILHVNGYGYIERGSFIYVYTLDEIKQIQAEERRLVSRVVKLNYLNANDAAEFVTPLLSDKGQIKTNGDVGSFSLPTDTPTGNEEFALSATLVLFDYEENINEIEALLKQLDTRPAQVLVEATILQTTLNESNAFGVDFALLNGLNFTDFFGLGGPLSVANNLIRGTVAPVDNDGSGLVSSPGNTAGPGTLKLSVINDDFSIFIKALDEVSDVSILSNPKILALNRQPARVLVGRKIGYLNTTSTETATTQTVEFLDTGTQLAFRPFISKDNMVRLELKPRVSEGVIRDAKDATGAAVTIPDEITQEITTNVIVPDGSTVVLGGLFRESTNLSRSQVPLIGDIPVIGAAFRGHEDKTDRNEIIFMIKPTVVNDKVLVEQGDRANDYAERVRTGTRQGLLPWSRDRQTSQLNVEAERYAAAGEKDKAMWAVRRSLELNPAQPEARRLQEELSGDKNWWPSRSTLKKIINGDAGGAAASNDNSEFAPASADAMGPTEGEQTEVLDTGASAEMSTAPSGGSNDVASPMADGSSDGSVFDSGFEGPVQNPDSTSPDMPQDVAPDMPQEFPQGSAFEQPEPQEQPAEQPMSEPQSGLMPQAIFSDYQNAPQSFNAADENAQRVDVIPSGDLYSDPTAMSPAASSFGPIIPGYSFAMYWSALKWRESQQQTFGRPATVSSVTNQSPAQNDEN